MNSTFYLMVFAVCLAANYGFVSIVQAAPPPASSGQFLVSHHSSNRVVRQAPPEGFPPPPEGFPPPPQPPSMWTDNLSRKRREAKGGGSMPTRKG